MLRTALRNVLAHKARLLMTALAVMLGVAFVSGTLVFTSTISQAFQKSSEEGFSHVDVALQPDRDGYDGLGQPARLSQKLLDDAAKLPGTASVIGEASGFAALADKDDKLVGEGWATTGGNYYAGQNGEDARYPLKDGRAPQKSGEIALDYKTAERTGYKVGEKVRMSVDGPVRQDKVVGIFNTDDGNVAAGGTLVLFDSKTAQQLFTAPGEYEQIILKTAEGTSQSELRSQVEKILPKDTKAVTGEKLAEDQSEAIATEMSGMQTGLLVFAGIALFVGIFIIANTFTMLVAQRTKELALMRAIGASRRQVTRSVLIEAAVVGTFAAVLGLLAGIGIGAGLRSLMNSLEMTIPDGPLVVGSSAVIASLAVGVLVTMLAAWLPARRAAKIPPVAAMSSIHAAATTKSLVVRNSIGSVLAAGGGALVLAGTGMGMDDAKGIMGLGALLLVIGVFVLTPLLSRPLIAAATPLLRVFGISGKLARQNSVRNPRRTAATASALMIGLTLITGMTVIASSFQEAINKMAADSLKADYTISMANMSPLAPEVGQKLEQDPAITAVSPLRTTQAEVEGKKETVAGVNGGDIDKLLTLNFDSGSFDELNGNNVVVDRDTAKKKGWKEGTTLPVTYEDGRSAKLNVTGIYEGNQMIQGVLADTRTIEPHMKQVGDAQVMVKMEGGITDANKTKLEEALGKNPAVLIQDPDDISEGIAMIFTMLLNILYGLLAMAVIVAVLGVVNTLAMSVFERSQEIGMLRAIGLDRRAVKRMVRLESVVIAVFGGVMGIGLGVFFGWAVGEVIGSGLSTYALLIPWDRLVIFLALAAVVGVLAAMWPARRAAKLNMLESIKAE
ncbi:ABC transporter permease [Streptomyces sp. XM4193]|uniref:ABC transporter permease n=1 Tax=Streptomyces sp. XM4193 TaxID=2929782 RepID=UPI001FFA0C62|nr:FtsX-like permease family protein [Streptomyces sp. XM4193]MCK1796923.1 ABC transporter permease [Streptomyces sp. XM4193]